MDAFDELLARGQRSADSLSTEETIKLLNEARDLGRPQAVAGIARAFLARHADPNPQILRLAARNSMLAGDYRLAVLRYRQYLRNAPANAESAEAAGELFQILVDYAAQGGEAATANAEFGDKFRQSTKARQYDTWFLETCWQGRATGAMAKRLATIFSEKLPLEQERFAYWHYLDRLTERLASIYPGNADAIIPARALVPLIREDAVRAARLRFFVENIAFHENRAGKNNETLLSEFEMVLAAARSYLDASPTESALRQVMQAFAGGPERIDEGFWSTLVQKKMEFFAAYGFSKLPESQQVAFLNWEWYFMPARLATPDQWIALGGKHPQAFQKAWGVFRLPWITQTADARVYKSQAQFLAGLSFNNALVINAMAAGNDANSSIQHLLSQASWQMPFVDRSRNPNVEILPDLVLNQIVPAWAALKDPMPSADAQLAFMAGPLFGSTMTPFVPGSIRDALRTAWGTCSASAERRERYMMILGKLAWVPFVGESRDRVFEPALDEFRGWAQETRRQFDRLIGRTDDDSIKRRTELEAVIAQIIKIEEAFMQAVQAVPDPAKAPTPECRELASLLKAIRAGDAPAYAAAAKALYASVREYQKNKTPFGEALLEFLMAPRDAKLDCFRQQVEFLADQLVLRQADPARHRGAAVCIRAVASREGWTFDGYGRLIARKDDAALRDRLAEVLGKAVETITAKDQWDGELFNWYMGVAQRDGEQAKAIVSAIVDRDIFTRNKVNLGFDSPTCSLLALIRNDFQSLWPKYPVETWFDDRLAAEIKRTGRASDIYWTQLYGQDRQKKVANAIAELFTADASYTFIGAPGAPAKYTRDQFLALSRRALEAEAPLANAYVAKVEAAYGKTRFDGVAAGSRTLGNMPIDTPEKRQAFFARMQEYANRARALPYHIELPVMPQLSGLPVSGRNALTDDEVTTLAACFANARWSGWSGTEDRLLQIIHDGLASRGRFGELFPLIPQMWSIASAEKRRETMMMLFGFASKLMENQEAPIVAAHSVAGLEVAGSRLPDDIRNFLSALRTRAMSKVGGGLLVDRTDKRYSILASQSLFNVGMLESAWKLYIQDPQLAVSECRELDIAFVIWLVERLTLAGDFVAARELVNTLIVWIESAPQGFDPETRTQMFIAAGDISLAADDLDSARNQYNRVAVAPEFANTLGAARAELKIAEVDRLKKEYDHAFERLVKLDGHRDSSIQAEARYQMAMVRFDQQDYSGTRDALSRVFTIAPGYPPAALLEGKLNVLTKKLIEATEVKLGLDSDQQIIIPGRPLRIGLEDRTLAVVGKATDIEIRAWTDSGDDELLTLTPFGDSKTRFRGEIATALAQTKKADGVLQVLGRDKVHYGFSERFRRTARVSIDDTVSVEVISDGELFGSSGRILTRAEQEELALEALIRNRIASEGKQIPASGSQTVGAAPKALSEAREWNQVKPGNPIYIRVIDADRSTTHQTDTINIRAMTTSGDVVSKFPLNETDPHSGVFEGKLPTVWAPATAYASDTEEGRLANHVISADKKLPPWVGLADKNRIKLLTVDLHDNAALGKLSLLADVPSRALKRFVVQTSLNGRDFATVATWPESLQPWDGGLRLRMVRYDGDVRKLSAQSSPVGQKQLIKVITEYFDYGRLVAGSPLHSEPGKTAADLSRVIGAVQQKLDLRRGQEIGSWALVHLQGVFYVSERRVRTFKLDAKGLGPNAPLVLAIDGTPAVVRRDVPGAPAREGQGSLPEAILSLGKGYHTLDLYAAVHAQTQVSYELLWDTQEAPFTARIPDAILSPAGWPAGMPPSGYKPEEIKASAKNTQFDVSFRPGANARLVRFCIFDFESDAPAVRKVMLTSADGKTLLPVKDELLASQNNQILEVVPGDRVTLTYEDPWVVNRDRQKLEVFLTATFNNGKIDPYYVTTQTDPETEETRTLFVPVKCYQQDVMLAALVVDPDEDVNAGTNSVKVVARTAMGKKVDLTAIEQSGSAGSFFCRFAAVSGPPKNAQELSVSEGDDLEIIYRDEENTDIGIPWNRVNDVFYVQPGNKCELRVYDYESRLLSTSEVAQASSIRAPAVKVAETAPADSGAEKAPIDESAWAATRRLRAMRPEEAHVPKPSKLMPGAPLVVEVLNKSLAFPPLNEMDVYVQIVTPDSEPPAGTKAAAFDPSLPGTIRYRFGLSPVPFALPPPIGYDRIEVSDPAALSDKMQEAIPGIEDRFCFVIPTALGSIEQMDTSSEIPKEKDRLALAKDIVTHKIACINENGGGAAIERHYKFPPLLLRPDYKIRVAINAAATNAVSATNAIATLVSTNAPLPEWEVREVHLAGDISLDVMDQKYRERLDTFNVGDRLYLRVVDPLADLSMEKDTISVSVVVSGATREAQPVKLMETFENTGLFKGNLQLVYEGLKSETVPPDVLAVPYGASVKFSYAGRNGEVVECQVITRKGADGTMSTFTKRFHDAEIAVQTQLTMAESYFVMAKKFRDRKEPEQARKTINLARKLLEEAIHDYPVSSARVQADYLLASLAFELAEQTDDENDSKRLFVEAISRFSDVIADYPDSEYAPKSQFRKAFVLERMGQIDAACVEYVKLSYRYPDHELVAETISRLGQYFMTKGKDMEKLLKSETDLVQREKIRLQVAGLYRTAAEVFGRLAKRFPSHSLAAKTQVLSGENWLRAQEPGRAIAVYEALIENKKASPELIAQAMYWCGDACMRMSNFTGAYRRFKTLTWEYPESTWARYARARLQEKAIAEIGAKEEAERQKEMEDE